MSELDLAKEIIRGAEVDQRHKDTVAAARNTTAAIEEANALHRRKLELDEANAANALAAARSASRAAWAAAIAATGSAVGILLQLWLR